MIRKNNDLIYAIILILLPLNLLIAQRKDETYSIGAFGGIGLLLSPSNFKDNYQMGIGIGGEYRYNFTEYTSIFGSFTYLPFKADMDKLESVMVGTIEEAMEETYPNVPYHLEGIQIGKETYTVNIIAAGVVQYFTPPEASMGLYATAGIGYYWQGFSGSTTEFTVVFPDSGTSEPMSWSFPYESEGDFGFNGGVGFELQIWNQLFLLTEVKLHYVFTEGEKMTFLAAMGGVRFTFAQ